jgi:4-amino-4-deoxy-L-arabinose transferase-like glycosyltransferase
MKKETILLIVITLLGFVFRFYALGDIPQSLARDEVSAAYNAYSIIKTARDEHGVLLPLAFKAFGDWKLPVEIYLEIPGIILFGLNAFSTRLPEALLGSLSVPLLYFMLRQAFRKLPESIPLAAAFFLAISPWHVFMSRVAFGYNVLGLFFFIGAVYFFFRFLSEKKPLLLFVSNVGFILTLFSYTAFHIFTPLFLLGLYLLYRKSIPHTRAAVIQVVLFVIFYAVASFAVLEANVQKIQGTSLWHYNDYYISNIWGKRQAYDDPLLARMMQNKPSMFLQKLTSNYILTFSPNFLVTEGGVNKVNNLENMGNMYLMEYVLFITGLGIFLYKREKGIPFVLLWLAVGAIPAIMTREAPHSTRNLVLIPMLVFLSGYGAVRIGEYALKLKGYKRVIGALIILGCVGLGLLNIVAFVDNYLFHFMRDRGYYWNAGYKEVVEFVDRKNPQKVVMERQSFSPYNYFLFHMKYDPAVYQREVRLAQPTWDNFQHVDSFGRYHFVENLDFQNGINEANVLYIFAKENIPTGYPVDGYIADPTGIYSFGWIYTDHKFCQQTFPNGTTPTACN